MSCFVDGDSRTTRRLIGRHVALATVGAVSDTDRRWLEAVVARATRNVADGGGPFAAVVVRGDEVVGEGVNRVTRDLDPTAHAEVVAIRAACQTLGDHVLTGSVLVVVLRAVPAVPVGSAVGAARPRRLRRRPGRRGAGRLRRPGVLRAVRPAAGHLGALGARRSGSADAAAPFEAWLANADRVDY